jgi:sortase A
VTTLLEHVQRSPELEPPRSRRLPKPARSEPSSVTAVVLVTMYAFAGLMIWAVAYALVFGAIQETRSQTVLYAQFRQQLADGTAPAGGLIKSGEPVAYLRIPRFGIHDVVVEGTSPRDLMLGPGHRADSPLPGEVGVSVLYGRGATFGAPFGELVKLSAGDSITVTDGAGTFTYIVDDVRRAGSPLPAPLAPGGSRITLASATGSGWHAHIAPSQPFYVDATLQGKALGDPAGRVSSVPSSNKLMGGDGSALASLTHWLELLIATGVLAAWVFTRWGRWQTWLVAVPAVLAVLWLVTETAFRLLPNVL